MCIDGREYGARTTQGPGPPGTRARSSHTDPQGAPRGARGAEPTHKNPQPGAGGAYLLAVFVRKYAGPRAAAMLENVGAGAPQIVAFSGIYSRDKAVKCRDKNTKKY